MIAAGAVCRARSKTAHNFGKVLSQDDTCCNTEFVAVIQIRQKCWPATSRGWLHWNSIPFIH